VQASGDHQMKNEPEIVVQAEGYSFADSAQFADCATRCIGERRLRGSHEERALESYMF
jgi:hypothetical protein